MAFNASGDPAHNNLNGGKASPQARTEDANVGDLLDLVKAYAKQETIDPLRNVGRYLAYGVAGGFLLAMGFVMLLISLLRVLQTETDVFDGRWSFAPYLIVVVVGGAIAGFFVSRISKGGLDA